MNDKLNPCPFCGRSDSLEIVSYKCSGTDWFYVTDTECMADGPACSTFEGAVYAWNERAEP